eukprot:GHRQ01029540.1.p3 GENE.GHRQ01029540.1~~GHRQ01029540.1.p3  ORF type:complete len:126 (+),score=26.29 GHRQ01029540.1:877-1254(+)
MIFGKAACCTYSQAEGQCQCQVFSFHACMQGKYRGSADERADLLQLVNRFRGNMRSVFDWLMLSRPELDSHRFRDILEEAIEAGKRESRTGSGFSVCALHVMLETVILAVEQFQARQHRQVPNSR